MKLTVKDIRATRARVQALLKRSGFPIQKGTGRLKDRDYTGVEVTIMGRVVNVGSYDAEEIKRAAQTLLDGGYELWSYVGKRFFTTPTDALLKNSMFGVKVVPEMGKQARPEFRRDLTHVFRNDFPTVVRDSVFQRVVAAFAHGLGGTTRDGVVRIPYAPHEFTVLYNKWYDPEGPMVAFMVFPAKKGNRSKMYRAFTGPVQDSKRLMLQFAAWLNMIKAAILKAQGVDTSGMHARLRGMKFASAMVTVIKQLEARPDFVAKTASVEAKALKWLEARARKGKGAFAPEVVQKAFEILGDVWSLEEVVTVTEKVSTWNKSKFMGGYFKGRDRDVGTSPVWTFSVHQQDAKEGDETISVIRSHTQEFSGKAPSNPRLGQMYITRPRIQKREYSELKVWAVDTLMCGTRGWKITTPKGTFTVGLPVLSSGEPEERGPAYKMPTVWTKLYKAGLQDAAKEALKGSEKVEKVRKKVEQQAPPKAYSKEVAKLLTSLTERKKSEAALYWEAQMQKDTELYKARVQKALDESSWPPDAYQVRALDNSFAQKFLDKWKTVEVDAENRIYTKVPYPEYDKDVMEAAQFRAQMFQEDFVNKNTSKLSAIIMRKQSKLIKQEVTRINPGPTDFGGELRFEFEDGSGFTVRNKTVWKSSANGKDFTQYPTTFHKVKMPDGKAMKGPSEKKMVEVFAQS